MRKLRQEDMDDLINKIKSTDHILVKANKLSYFISDALRENQITLYEGYVLNLEIIKLNRISYTQPAWNKSVQISTCVTILNQYLLAKIFDNSAGAEMLKKIAAEAFLLNKEKRSHYIMDHYKSYFENNNSEKLLQDLLEIRNNYDKLSDDDGPYHVEAFPYHFHHPEKILLEKNNSLDQNISSEVENILIYLNT
ncbi:hypothetical protein [Flavobacterium tistrianum]|uniref:hypothetical protein n=1 Tax=Flavobacterium tistrianum TaxID=1685414 RepID=UPI000DAE0010|nr:hypothetical protein [Flavobacterium tistrianum]KAF2342342.1 hypothetical protein DMB71_04080 [Flavobacterium tistrianum]